MHLESRPKISSLSLSIFPFLPSDPPCLSCFRSLLTGILPYSVSADLHRSASWSQLCGRNYSSPRGLFSLSSCPSKEVLRQSNADRPSLVFLHVMQSQDQTLALQCVTVVSDHPSIHPSRVNVYSCVCV